jgi:4-amino-4-deoxy-L-arabinose transferase-like glycosyltransferase
LSRDPLSRISPPVVRRVVALVLVAGALRLPFVGRPLSPDEAGFLMIARQWGHGSSLYGDYWVDRPPLLVLLFRVAAFTGGEVPLRLLGAFAVMATVALAAVLGGQVAPRRSGPVMGAATTLVLLDSPLFGGLTIDGELLAVPFVLAGLCCIIRASHPGVSRRWWLLAGVCAMSAGLVKQSLLDVFALAAAVLVWRLLRARRRAALVDGLVFAAGALVTLVVILGIAWLHGTTPAGVWDAVVVFRGEASDVIATHASPATGHRARVLVVKWLLSGAPILLAVALIRKVGQPQHTDLPLGWLSGALLGWETLGVLAGGSYWPHYLIGTVPGTVFVLARALAGGASVRRYGAALVACAVSLLVTTGYVLVEGMPRPAGVPEVEAWLQTHTHPGETGVVAWGHAELLANSGLQSPYRELWSLPVRVRDPELRELTRVLSGPDRPTWLIVRGPHLSSWGIDDSLAKPVVDARYAEVTEIGFWRIFHVR